MKVIFTSETKEDFRKHNDYVRRLKKSDGHKYQSYELKGINKSFKKNLKDNLEKIKTPKDSIDLKTKILESKIVSLVDYLKQMIG